MKTKPESKRQMAQRAARAFAACGIALVVASCGESISATITSDADAHPKQVVEEAEKIFDERFARDGDSFYTVVVTCGEDVTDLMGQMAKAAMGGEFDLEAAATKAPLLLVRMQLVEMKKVSTDVTAHPLTEADKLNGITWKGLVDVGAEVERRRTLDLIPTFEKILEEEGTAIEIPWTERKLNWVARGAGITSIFDMMIEMEMAKNPDAEKVLRVAPAARLFAGMLDEAIVGGFRGDDWGDWKNADGRSYQYSRISVRDGKATSDTNESIGDLIKGDTFVFRAPKRNGVGGMGGIGKLLEAAAHEDASTVFLLKPNLEALQEAGFLD